MKTNLSKKYTTNNEDYIEYIKILSNEKTMMIFTDGSALGNPGPTGSDVAVLSRVPRVIAEGFRIFGCRFGSNAGDVPIHTQ